MKRTSRHLTIALLVIVGALLLGVGPYLEQGSYTQGLFLNIGTGVLLFAVLYLIQQHVLDRVREVQEKTQGSIEKVSRHVDAVRDDLKATEARLGEVGEQTRALLREQVGEVEKRFDDFRTNVSPASVVAILNEAAKVRGISHGGVRVRIPNTDLRIRFNPVPAMDQDSAWLPGPVAAWKTAGQTSDSVRLTIERVNGQKLRDIAWGQAQSAAGAMRIVAQHLQQLGEYPGEAGFDPDAIFEGLRALLDVAIRARTRRGSYPPDLGSLIELPNDEWVITDSGVESLKYPYVIPRARFDEQWRPHMSTKAWVDPQKFDEAFTVASRLFPPTAQPEPV